jgi:hypothetical protein
MQIPIEVSPEELLDVLRSVYVHRHAYAAPGADIPDLVRSAFLTGLRKWVHEE